MLAGNSRNARGSADDKRKRNATGAKREIAEDRGWCGCWVAATGAAGPGGARNGR